MKGGGRTLAVVTGASSGIGRRIAVDKRSRCDRLTTEEYQPRIPSPALRSAQDEPSGASQGRPSFPVDHWARSVAGPTGSFASGSALR